VKEHLELKLLMGNKTKKWTHLVLGVRLSIDLKDTLIVNYLAVPYMMYKCPVWKNNLVMSGCSCCNICMTEIADCVQACEVMDFILNAAMKL